jgi:hypothetical protein
MVTTPGRQNGSPRIARETGVSDGAAGSSDRDAYSFGFEGETMNLKTTGVYRYRYICHLPWLIRAGTRRDTH